MDKRQTDELWGEIHDIVLEEAKKNIPQVRRKQKANWLSNEALTIVDRRRKLLEGLKATGDRNTFTRLNAEFQRKARKDEEKYLQQECQEMEDNNQRDRTRLL